MVDLEVDKETGRVTILRYTVAQDAGRAVHPDYVEGQYQGGAVQGIGWALNEEYIYGPDGRLQNPGFLDYRMPVASDVPMIDTVIVEVPNPRHPYGVRGVGETPIVPPMAAIANAIEQATGIRFTELPMSPPKVLKAARANSEADGEIVNAASLRGAGRRPATTAPPWQRRWSTRSIILTPSWSAAISCAPKSRTLQADLIGTIWRVVLTVFGIPGGSRRRAGGRADRGAGEAVSASAAARYIDKEGLGAEAMARVVLTKAQAQFLQVARAASS